MATPDLSGMSVEELADRLMIAADKLYDTYMDDHTPLHKKDHKRQELRAHVTLVKAELSRRMTPPPGCVRTHEGKDLKVLGTSEEGWILVGRDPNTGLCYPFAQGVCDNPKCNCREEKQAAEATRSSKE
jgi:hypothetical protein